MRIVCHYSVRTDLNKPSHSILIVDSPIVDRNVSLMSVFNEITADEADSVLLIGYLADCNAVTVEKIES